MTISSADTSIRLLPGTAVDETLWLVREGNNIVMHCHAGLGCSALFAACMAIRQLGLNGERAIDRILDLLSGSMESDVQEKVIREFLLKEIKSIKSNLLLAVICKKM